MVLITEKSHNYLSCYVPFAKMDELVSYSVSKTEVLEIAVQDFEYNIHLNSCNAVLIFIPLWS